MKRLQLWQVILLAAWLGAAMLVATAVAPASFRVLPTRALAGALVGQVLPVIFIGGLLIALTCWWMEVRLAGPMSPVALTDGVLRLGLVAMIFCCTSAQFTVAPKIAQLRDAMGVAVDALPTDDPRRVRFGMLHATSVVLMGASMAGAAIALCRKLYLADSSAAKGRPSPPTRSA